MPKDGKGTHGKDDGNEAPFDEEKVGFGGCFGRLTRIIAVAIQKARSDSVDSLAVSPQSSISPDKNPMSICCIRALMMGDL